MTSRAPPTKRNAGAAPGGEATTSKGKPTATGTSAQAPDPRPFSIVIWGARCREWSRYATFEQADDQVRALRKHGLDAHIEGPDDGK